MKFEMFIILFLLWPMNTCEYAYVSTLSSDSFLTAAQVLAHRLKSFNDYPYLVIVTEEISNASISSLRSMDVIVEVRQKIDTPYLDVHKAKKYQYTKIHLWSLTNYTRIIHLDLDVLPREPISQLFKCGTFCASFRHSDKFNSGVFVVEPNMTIYKDMIQKASLLKSYDGGDQGFLNSYFCDLKYSPMFNDDNATLMGTNSSMHTLSAAYNYDVAMYYLNNQILIRPKIIHYTFGPVKPWLWWTYPLFDLNWEWLKARYDMEKAYDFPQDEVSLILTQVVCGSILYVIFLITKRHFCARFKVEETSVFESNFTPIVSMFYALIVSFESAPATAHPAIAWIYFFSNVIMWLIFLSALYNCVRFSRSLRLKNVFRFILCLMLIFCANWMILFGASSFHRRLSALFLTVPLSFFTTCLLQNKLLIRIQNYDTIKYCHVTYSDTVHPKHLC